MTVAEERARAVAETVARIRAVERERGVVRAALDEIKALLIELAARRVLFPWSDFPPPGEGEGSVLYRLSEDEDHRFALYLSSARPGKGTRPHNHTTWAVIVGIEGDEHNRFYERLDDGSVPGRGEVRQSGERTVRPGTGVCLMPDDVHSIHVDGPQPTLHFHMYGLALEQLAGRIGFDVQAGTYEVFPPHRDIRAPAR